METIAEKHCKLAAESKEEIGYVLPNIAKMADCEALYGHWMPGGYELVFEDGSSLFYNPKTNDLTRL